MKTKRTTRKESEATEPTMNRAITTGHNENVGSQMIELEVLADTMLNGTSHKAGETVKVSKSEARRLLTVRKSTFRVA